MNILVTGCLTLLEDIWIIRSLLLMWLFRLSLSFKFFWFHFLYHCLCCCMFCVLLFNFVSYVFFCLLLFFLFLRIFCSVYSSFIVSCYLLCSVQMCAVLLPPGVNPTAVNKYIKYQTSNIKHQISNIKHQTSNIKHEISNIKNNK